MEHSKAALATPSFYIFLQTSIKNRGSAKGCPESEDTIAVKGAEDNPLRDATPVSLWLRLNPRSSKRFLKSSGHRSISSPSTGLP